MEQSDNTITLEQFRRFLYCPRQFHLSLVTSDAEIRAWRDRENEEEGPTWPKIDAEIAKLDILGSTLPLTGSVNIVYESERPCPVLWHGSAPATGIREDHKYEVAIVSQIIKEQLGSVGPAFVLYHSEKEPRRHSPSSQDWIKAQEVLGQAIELSTQLESPEPYDDDPRCGFCPFIGLCLPDEHQALSGNLERTPQRPMTPRDDALPLHVQEQGAKVGKSGESLVVSKAGKTLAEVHLKDVSQLVLHGNVFVSAQTIHLLANHSIPITHLSTGGWFYGVTQGFAGSDVALRRAQYRFFDDTAECLTLAKLFIEGKIANQRTQLRRNGSDVSDDVMREMAQLEKAVSKATDMDVLRGYEGMAARLYFGEFHKMLHPRAGVWPADVAPLNLEGRNRRPPRDPVNSLLSYAYAVLAKECTVALVGVGLDPQAGFLHAPSPGRPSLALDLMEEFRPVAADSAVLTALNTGMVGPNGFQQVGEACWLSGPGRKGILQAWENRLDQLATHPIFDYRCSLRRIIRLQARLLAQYVRGETKTYLPYKIR